MNLVILGVMIALWFAHRRTRKENQIRLEQYYNEQVGCSSAVSGARLIQADRVSAIHHVHVTRKELPSLPSPQRRMCWRTRVEQYLCSQTAEHARQSMLSEDAYGYTTGTDAPGLLPPNMRRDSSAAWSEAADSDVLLMHNGGHGQSKGRRQDVRKG